jgi:G3E family GTPase
MRVIEPGHVYELDTLDGAGEKQRLVFVNREPGTEHAGTQTQEVLRATIDVMGALVDRTNHCDACLRWEGNDQIVKALTEAQRQMRLALLKHEQRAMERKLDRGDLAPERLVTGADGHVVLEHEHEQDEHSTLTSLVVQVVHAQPGMEIGAIVAAVRAKRATANVTSIYPTVYRAIGKQLREQEGRYYPVLSSTLTEVLWLTHGSRRS